MSNVCNTCSKPINWDKHKREVLGIKGPLNLDYTVHKCYATVKTEVEDASSGPSAPPQTAVLTQEEIWTLKQFVLMLKMMVSK
jgi:hypothetical protein